MIAWKISDLICNLASQNTWKCTNYELKSSKASVAKTFQKVPKFLVTLLIWVKRLHSIRGQVRNLGLDKKSIDVQWSGICSRSRWYFHTGTSTLLIMGVFHEWIFFWKIMVPAIWTIHALSETPWSLASKPRAWRVRAIFLFLSTRFVEIVLIHVCHFGLVVFLIFGIYLDIWELSRYLGVFGIFGNHLNILYSIEHSWAWQSPV